MKLVYPVLWSRLERGADREQTASTAAALARQGIAVTLLVPQRPHDPPLSAGQIGDYFEVEASFRVIQRHWRWVGTQALPSALWLKRALRDPEVLSADVLLSRAPAMLASGQACPIPFATDHYRPWPDDLPILRPLIRRTARNPRCLGFILHSDFAADSYRRIGIAEEQLLVAHNGADLDRFDPALDRASARARIGVCEARPIVVYAGRINTAKGLDQVLALADLRPGVDFLLVGSEGDGPVERAAASRANVRVIPWQLPGALPAYLAAADVLIVPPSRAPLEQFGNCVLPIKLFAYFAAGRPILAPQAADTAGFLHHGENAWLVAPDDPQAAAHALDRLLTDTALADRLGRAALAEAQGLSWDHRAARIVRFIAARLAGVSGRNIL